MNTMTPSPSTSQSTTTTTTEEDNNQSPSSSSVAVVPLTTTTTTTILQQQECTSIMIEPTSSSSSSCTILEEDRSESTTLCSWSNVKIKERIGSGSFAMVLKANYYEGEVGGNHRDKKKKKTKKKVALKCIKDGQMDSMERGYALEGIRSEGQILSKLNSNNNHPNIVTVIAISDIRRNVSSPFIVMELLHKDTLDDKIKQWGHGRRLSSKRMTKQQQQQQQQQTETTTTTIRQRRRRSSSSWWGLSCLKIRSNTKARRRRSTSSSSMMMMIDVVPTLYDRMYHIGYKISDAIQYLHSKQILHYDIKPSNIGFDLQSGNVKIFDFGLSEDLSQSKPKDDFLTGSPRYMAPEVMVHQNNHNNDTGTDTDTTTTTTTRKSKSSNNCLLLMSADIYSFAITLWEIITLEKSHRHINDVDNLIDMVVNKGGRPSLESIYNASLRNLLDSCWNTDPSKRPNSKNLLSSMAKVVSEIKQEQQEEEKVKILPAAATDVAAAADEVVDNNSVVNRHVLDGLSKHHVNNTIKEERRRRRESSSLLLVEGDRSCVVVDDDDESAAEGAIKINKENNRFFTTTTTAAARRRKLLRFGTEKTVSTVSTVSMNSFEDL